MSSISQRQKHEINRHTPDFLFELESAQTATEFATTYRSFPLMLISIHSVLYEKHPARVDGHMLHVSLNFKHSLHDRFTSAVLCSSKRSVFSEMVG